MKFMAVKVCRVVKPVPLVLRANTVPLPDIPSDVPYRVLPDKSKPCGTDPSVPFVKLCKVVNPVPLVLTLNTVPYPELPPFSVVPYRVLPDITNPTSGPAPSLLV